MAEDQEPGIERRNGTWRWQPKPRVSHVVGGSALVVAASVALAFVGWTRNDASRAQELTDLNKQVVILTAQVGSLQSEISAVKGDVDTMKGELEIYVASRTGKN